MPTTLKTGNISSALSRNGFKNVPNYLKEEISDFANEVMSTPTQYFESKPQRAVELGEFTGAVVPKGTRKEVVDVLRKNGVTVNYYEQGKTNKENEDNRRDAIEKLAERKKVMFRVADSQEELDNFVKDSKVKETVYHGTASQFDEFLLSKAKDEEGMRRGLGWGPDKFYFTDTEMSAQVAADYAEIQGKGDTPNVMRVKLNLTNPISGQEYTDKLRQYEEELGDRAEAVKQLDSELKAEGIDGIDDTNISGGIAVFSPDQILIEPKEDVKFRVEEERDKVETNPSEAQVEAGNYQKGHIKLDGFDISIENPRGSIRKGTNEKGEEWSAIMPNDYGYFRGTIGKDKDQIDVHLGPNLESDKVYVVDQINPETGAFDEHKVMMGFDNISDARNAYNEAYEEGWQGLGNITRTTKEGLKEWFKGDTKKPFAGKDKVMFQVAPKTDSEAFKKWFGDSKVVDNNGSPLVVYHGTASDFDVFSKEKMQDNFNQADLGFYFTNAPRPGSEFYYGSTASEYAENAQKYIYDEEKGSYKPREGANVMPVYLSIKKPLMINAEGWYSPNQAIDKQRNDIKRWLNEGDYDGVIAYNPDPVENNPERIYIVKNPSQIKSATGNVGTYNPMSDNIRFQVTSTNPEIQAMLDRLQAVQAMSESAAKVRGLEEEQRMAIGPAKKFLQDKLDLYKEAVAEGKKEAKDMISEVQKAITDYAKKALPLTEAGAKEISPILTLVKNAQTPEDIESAINRIDELAGLTTEKQERRKAVSKVNRLLKWMTGLKKSGTKRVGKFNYEDTTAFQELKDIEKEVSQLSRVTRSNKATAEEKAEADSKLDAMWNEINEKPDKNNLDEAILKLIELRRLGAKASSQLAQTVAEELEAIYSAAKEAKSEADIDAALTRKEEKEFVKQFLTGNDKALKDKPWFKRALTQLNTSVADIMGNWETLMTMIGGQKLRDRMSLMLNEAQMAVGRQETMDNVLNEAKDIYGAKTRTETLNTIHDLSAEDYELRQPNRKGEEGEGQPMKLSKLHLMDIYNAIKNEDVERDYYMAYGDITLAEDGSRDIEAQIMSGKKRIDALLNNLDPQDKAFADALQMELDKYYAPLNDIHIKLYNRDLPRVDNYWPSTAEREVDIDVLSQFFVDSRHPSATKERSSHRIPEPRDAFNKFTKHVDEAEWYTNMALPINDINKIFKDNNVKSLIEDARGKGFYKNINEAIANVGLMPPGKQQQSSKLTSWLNPLLNNWVASKIGATPSVPLKQLLSAVNYAENMPAEQWVGGFIKTMSNPKKAWQEMMEIPYLKTRLGDGYSEAVQRALNGDENVHRSRISNFHSAFKNLMTIGTRYGDIAAIVFGGKPYLDYLVDKKGLSQEEAVDKFLQDTLRSQQSPFSSTLSKMQNSKNPFFRAIFAFSNTPSQYMRKMFEANQNYRVVKQQFESGNATKEELNEAKKKAAKSHAIYGLVNTVTFTMAGSLINSMMRGSDPDDEIWKDIVNQLGQTYIGGLPVIKDLLGSFTRKSLGMPVYDNAQPFVEGLDEVVDAGIKLSKGDAKKPEKEYEKIAQGVATMLGVPYYNIKKDIKAIPPFRDKTVSETRIKEVDNKLKDLKTSRNNFEARMATDLKQAYSTAKSKATRLRKEGKVLQADMIDQLIEDSKLKLRENEYDKLGVELRMFKSRLEAIN